MKSTNRTIALLALGTAGVLAFSGRAAGEAETIGDGNSDKILTSRGVSPEANLTASRSGRRVSISISAPGTTS
ncbi:hypothetical protein [Agreia sp. COWG]|uniref:hypothetical protein n=1 Tax=Agreia sp. COWG TaxID=2773266 RepID=UPI0019296F5D|nr:hypothetical protein [Agreia sp. COWG]CAD5997251.1 exported protein of unknown function [Agreia sp. COWG]